MSDIHKLTGAYALDAVDDLERARFEQHLAECDDCRAEVAGLRETAALLAESAATPPPASLRESVLAGISQVRPLPPVVAPPASGADRTSSRRRLPLLVAAALVLIAGLGAVVWQPWNTDAPQLTAAEQVISAEDAEKVSLDLGEAGRATVVRSVSQDRAVIVTEDMVEAPAGKAYELWFQTPEQDMVPAGLMPDDPDATVVLEGSAADAIGVGITVEPDSGSPKPSSDPIALFDLTQAA